MPFVELALPPGQAGALWRYSDGRGRALAPHRHAELEANLVLRGHARYLTGDRARQLMPNTLVWLFPDQDHLLVEASPDFDMWIAVFRPDFIEHQRADLPQTAASASDATEVRSLPEQIANDLGHLADAINLYGSDPALFDAGLAWWLLRAWHEYGMGAVAPTQRVHRAVRRAAILLRDDPCLDLPTLSKAVGLSPSRLSRLFKAEMGTTITQLRNRVRMDRVDEIMTGPTSVPLLTAALSAGFGSYAQFFRIFRDLRHVNPQDYYGGLRNQRQQRQPAFPSKIS